MPKDGVMVVSIVTTLTNPREGYILEFGMCLLDDLDGYDGTRVVSTMWDRLREHHWSTLVSLDTQVSRDFKKSGVTEAAQKANRAPRTVERMVLNALSKAGVDSPILVAKDAGSVIDFIKDEMPELTDQFQAFIDLDSIDTLCKLYNEELWRKKPDVTTANTVENYRASKTLQADMEEFIFLRDNFLFLQGDEVDFI